MFVSRFFFDEAQTLFNNISVIVCLRSPQALQQQLPRQTAMNLFSVPRALVHAFGKAHANLNLNNYCFRYWVWRMHAQMQVMQTLKLSRSSECVSGSVQFQSCLEERTTHGSYLWGPVLGHVLPDNRRSRRENQPDGISRRLGFGHLVGSATFDRKHSNGGE